MVASAETKELMARFPALGKELEAVDAPHRALHASAAEVGKALAAGDTNAANRIYQEKTVAALDEVARHFHMAVNAEETLVQAQAKARQVLLAETLPALTQTRKRLNELKHKAEADLDGRSESEKIYAENTAPVFKESTGAAR